MSSPCDVVAERVALGEPLGDVADHATSCAKCRRLAALPTELGVVSSEADPGLGFTARMTSGAQHLLVVRQRRRIVAAAVSAAAAKMTSHRYQRLLLTIQRISDYRRSRARRRRPPWRPR